MNSNHQFWNRLLVFTYLNFLGNFLMIDISRKSEKWLIDDYSILKLHGVYLETIFYFSLKWTKLGKNQQLSLPCSATNFSNRKNRNVSIYCLHSFQIFTLKIILSSYLENTWFTFLLIKFIAFSNENKLELNNVIQSRSSSQFQSIIFSLLYFLFIKKLKETWNKEKLLNHKSF